MNPTPRSLIEYMEHHKGRLGWSATPTTWPDGTKTSGAWIYGAGSTQAAGRTIREAIENHMGTTNEHQ